MANLIMDTPSRHVYTGDGSTRVFPIPTLIEGDDWVRIEINGEHQIDRSKWDIVNNSIIFVTAPEADAVVDVLVASSIEAMVQFGSASSIDIVAQNIANVNLVGQDIEAIINVSDNLNIVTEGFEEVKIVAENIEDVNTVAVNIVSINELADMDVQINTLYTDIGNINNVGNNIANVNIVSDKVSELTHLSDNIDKVDDIALYSTQIQIVGNDLANSYEYLDDYGLITDAVSTESNNISNIETVATNIADVQNALTNATIAKEEAWKAEADRLTAQSYATEPENVFVKVYTSNNDGTFTVTDTTDYSASHWEKKAADLVATGIIDDVYSASNRTYSSNKIDSIVTNINDNITTIVTDNITPIENGIDIIEGDIVALEGRTTTIEGRAGTIEGDITALEGRATTLEGDIVALEGRAGTLEGRATALEGDVSTLNTTTVKLTGDQTISDVKTFLESPIAPTPTAGDNSTKIATTAFVKANSGTGSIGVGQTWQNVSRSAGVTYTNTTGKPIAIHIALEDSNTTSSGSLTVTVDSISITSYSWASTAPRISESFIVPNNSTYRISMSGSAFTISRWTELR